MVSNGPYGALMIRCPALRCCIKWQPLRWGCTTVCMNTMRLAPMIPMWKNKPQTTDYSWSDELALGLKARPPLLHLDVPPPPHLRHRGAWRGCLRTTIDVNSRSVAGCVGVPCPAAGADHQRPSRDPGHTPCGTAGFHRLGFVGRGIPGGNDR